MKQQVGEKLMDTPKVAKDCWEIFKVFGLVMPSTHDYMFENATQLVMVNNQLYHALNP